MAQTGLKISYTLTFAPCFKQWARRTVTKAMEEANHRLGQHWFKRIFPKHFTLRGAREYKYEKRAPGYEKAKKKRGLSGQPLPLVGLHRKGHKAGTLMRTMKRAGLVRATRKRVRVTMQAPRYVNMRGEGGSGIDKVKELMTISEKEAKHLAKMYGRWMVRILQNEPRRTRIRA